MKNSVRLLSVMLLISMLFSMSAVSASAIVSDGSSAGGMVIIGGTEAPVNNDGMLVIGAEQRPEDDSPYRGDRVEDSPSYDQQISQAKNQQASAVTLNAIQEEAKKYLGLNEEEGFAAGILRAGFSSVADLFVAQMQDYLELGAEARINEPGSIGGNWTWRTMPDVFTETLAQRIAAFTELYGRSK